MRIMGQVVDVKAATPRQQVGLVVESMTTAPIPIIR